MGSETWTQLKRHAPFTAMGALSAGAVMVTLTFTSAPRSLSQGLFWTFHPLHVLLSALVTTGMYVLHGGRGWWKTVLIGYIGSVGIATISDSVIPFLGEWLLALPHRGIHLGFIDRWWLVNPMALAGIALGCLWPRTRVSHASHVFLSTWASLFHMTMALGDEVPLSVLVAVPLFLFLAVWLPCCTSDIVFPILFAPASSSTGAEDRPGCSRQKVKAA